ncbi:MAG: CsbD family protein [Chloroflexi bacterium]|nr:CsbD family protein [Chloroflexota bacterium]
MNEDIFEGKWKQAKGQIKQWWGELTDDDVKQVEGNRDKLIGKLQERYGYTRQRAEDEVNRRFNEYERQNRP